MRGLRALAALLVLGACAGMQVNERWDAHERRWRDAYPVATRALPIVDEDLDVLDRVPVFRIGMLVVVQPVDRSEAEFRAWLSERAADRGGTHFMSAADLQALGSERLAEKEWLGQVRIEERDLQQGATHYVVFQVRRSRWQDLPEALQPTPR